LHDWGGGGGPRTCMISIYDCWARKAHWKIVKLIMQITCHQILCFWVPENLVRKIQRRIQYSNQTKGLLSRPSQFSLLNFPIYFLRNLFFRCYLRRRLVYFWVPIRGKILIYMWRSYVRFKVEFEGFGSFFTISEKYLIWEFNTRFRNMHCFEDICVSFWRVFIKEQYTRTPSWASFQKPWKIIKSYLTLT
jgi:hypothetical protein